MAAFIKAFGENRKPLSSTDWLPERFSKVVDSAIPPRGAVTLRSFQAFFAAVVLQDSLNMPRKADEGTFAFDLLVKEGDVVSYIGRQFLDILIASGQAAYEDSNRAKEEHDFVERQQLKRLDDNKKIEIRVISAKQNLIQQMLSYYKFGAAFSAP